MVKQILKIIQLRIMFFRNKRQVIKDIVSILQPNEDRHNNNNIIITKTVATNKNKKTKLNQNKGSEGDIFKRQQPYNPYYFQESSNYVNSAFTSSNSLTRITSNQASSKTSTTEESRRGDSGNSGFFSSRR